MVVLKIVFPLILIVRLLSIFSREVTAGHACQSVDAINSAAGAAGASNAAVASVVAVSSV